MSTNGNNTHEHIQITRNALDLEVMFAFRSNAHARIDGLWSEAVSSALSNEARGLFASAELPSTGPRTPLAPEHAPDVQTAVSTGPLLSKLHIELLGVARAISGKVLAPAFSAYGYYPMDDRCVLHLDTDECDVTLLIEALGDLGPLHVHPQLAGCSMNELGRIESDASWNRHSGLPVRYPKLGVTALAGKQLPHHRPGRPVAELCAVAALHYQSVL